MEPFFIFCCVLVLYCGYLTLTDLLRERQPATPPEPAEQCGATRAGRRFFSGRPTEQGRMRAGGTAGQFPLLSRGSA